MTGDTGFSLGDLLERLRRVEEMLEDMRRRLDALEAALRGARREEEARTLRSAALLVAAAGVPLSRAVEASARILRLAGRVEGLTRRDFLVLEIVAARPGLSLRGLERLVRKAEGRASRGSIKRSLARLALHGLVRVEYDGRRYRVLPGPLLSDEGDEEVDS